MRFISKIPEYTVIFLLLFCIICALASELSKF